MTDTPDFANAFARFRAMPYPSYPRLGELQDWNSELLTVDSHIAGYASRVHAGQMSAGQIPHLADLVVEVESLRVSLQAIQPQTEEDRKDLEEYSSYVLALELMTIELNRLARAE